MKSVKNGFVDKILLISILTLVFFGVVMVYDASVVYSLNQFGESYRFLIFQLMWAGLGLFLMMFASRISLDFVKKISPFFYVASLVFLVLALLPTPFSPQIYGARRWIILNPEPFPPLPFLERLSFQPSDFAKLSYIIYISFLLTKGNVKGIAAIRGNLLTYVSVTAIPAFLILLSPDFGTFFLFFVSSLVALFVSGQHLAYFLMGIPILSLSSLAFILSSVYRKQRLFTFLRPESSDSLSGGYHISQILISLGSGGLFGLGLGQSRQKYSYLPEVTADSIFAIIGEELGLIGTLLTVFIVVLIVYRGFTISQKTTNLTYKVMSAGIASLFSIQAFMNIGSMLRIIPLTGIPLPLVSYGGSSMVFTLVGLGLLLNISRQS